MKKLTLLAGTIALLASTSQANAASLPLFSGLNLLEDDNREYLIDKNGNGLIDVGESLRGVIEFGKIEQLDSPFGVLDPLTTELTGIFETELKAVVDYDGDGQTDDFIWGTSANFTNVYGANSMVALYTGGTNLILNSCVSIAACETAATDGALWATFGLVDADDQWISLNSNPNINNVAGLSAATKVATVNYALSMITNNTGFLFNEIGLDCASTGGIFACAGDGKTDLIGSGDILGGRGLTNGYQARSDIDAQLNVIPEPHSLALLGIGLLGLSFKRKQA